MKNTEMDFEKKNHVTELKAVPDGKNLYIEGYASVFNVPDSYKDIVLPGAFTKTLATNFKRVKFCWQHEMDEVIGKIVEMKEDSIGLWFRAKLSNTTQGKDIAVLLEDGAIDEISFAYRTVECYFDQKESEDIRYLKEVELIEISIVSRAANQQAKITTTEVKSFKKEIKDYTNTELVAIKKEIDTEYNKRLINLI